ncbi:uncharacterized protein LOC106533237 [Austrofundulus limnaeus]|uniref:Uncharacterized protein LOC106533237 n=1 Tax=Austrofundulus limnaeus TaxID=52670 RepID=A0A2I4CY74_AUSLI|nr:PREDICTED: uncharacterized protein LOC106533237 [Austrofundulus limnaeus]
MFNLKTKEQSASHSEYAINWRKRMEEAYRLASRTSEEGREKAEGRYNQKIYGTDLYPGCRVLVRNFSERGGPGKLRSFWEDQVYVVTERKYDGGPVYEVRPEQGGGRAKVLHRNLLLPCDFLPVEQIQPEPLRPAKSKFKRHGNKQQEQQRVDLQSASDEEEDWRGIRGPTTEGYGQLSVQLRTEAEEFRPLPATQEPEDNTGQMEQHQDAQEEDGAEPEAVLEDRQGEELDHNNAEPSPTATRKYPPRNRQPAKTLTYDSLGQPSLSFRQ